VLHFVSDNGRTKNPKLIRRIHRGWGRKLAGAGGGGPEKNPRQRAKKNGFCKGGKVLWERVPGPAEDGGPVRRRLGRCWGGKVGGEAGGQSEAIAVTNGEKEGNFRNKSRNEDLATVNRFRSRYILRK